MTMLWTPVCECAEKPDQWLVYWYVCGTDIESARIAFRTGTNLLSDDPNALFLADPVKKPGDATRCINEVEKATLSPNIKIFMQAGGTYVWGHKKFRDNNAKFDTRDTLSANNFLNNKGIHFQEWYLTKASKPVKPGKLSRYVYDQNHRNWLPREQLPISGKPNTITDMGSQAGLIDFLKAGQRLERELYPDGNVRRAFIFVDHGVTALYGLYGICKDAYTGNALSLQDIQSAFSNVKDGWTNPEDKPFEVVAFDACVMSVYETAIAVKDAANYMVASQEETVGKVMFGYTGLLNELSSNPAMSGAELGRVICKTYWDDSKKTDKEFGTTANTVLTLSVVDLSEKKMDALTTAYSNFGKEAQDFARQHPEEFLQIFTKLKNAANRAEKYPSTAMVTAAATPPFFGKYDAPLLVDLQGLAKNTGQNVPELKQVSKDLVAAVEDAVIYQKRGDSLKQGGGLSIWYPVDLINSGKNIKAYQEFIAESQLTPKTQGNLYGLLYEGLKAINASDHDPLALSELKDAFVEVNENKKTAWVELDEDQCKKIEGVRFNLVQVQAIEDKLQGRVLGVDSGMRADWKAGKFESTFDGKWIAIEGQPVFAQVVSGAARANKRGKKIGGSEICSIPILLNNKMCMLFVTCEYPKEKFTVIGAVPIVNERGQIVVDEKRRLLVDEKGMPRGLLYGFNPGDVVTPIQVKFALSEDDVDNIELRAQKIYGRAFDDLSDEEKIHITQDIPYGELGTPITVGNQKLKVAMSALPDGNYAYMFEFVNPINSKYNARADEIAIFKVRDGKIVEVKHSDDIEDLKDFR